MNGGSFHHIEGGGSDCPCEYARNLDSNSYTTSNYEPGNFAVGPAWVTPVLTGGTYLLTTTLLFQVSSSGRTLDAYVRNLAGPTTLIDFIRSHANESGAYHIVTVRRQVTLAAGSHTLQLLFKKLSGGGTITVDETEMILEKV